MNRATLALACALVAASLSGRVLGGEADAPPAPAAGQDQGPPGEKIPATVKTVEGTVETRPSVGQPWGAVQVGQQLAEGADLRTGFRARCVLDLSDSLVQVDPLTVVRIGELRKDGGTVHTRLIIKQGNTQADVEKGLIKSDFAIVTPSATLSVRGTRGIRAGHFQGLGSNFQLLQSGSILLTGPLGNTTPLAPGQQTNGPGTPAMNFLSQQHQNPTMDNRGLEQLEQNACNRNPMPLPPVSPLGGGPTEGLGSLQQEMSGLVYTGPPPVNPGNGHGNEHGPEYEP